MFKRMSSLSLRSRLLVSYIVLITVSIGILGIGYYYKSSEVVLENASQTILSIVKKGNQSLDDKFSSVEKIAVNMHLDDELYRFFNEKASQSHGYAYEDDRSISRILQKYFPMSEDLYSVNLVTAKYIYGDNPNFWIPKTNMSDSDIYHAGLQSTERTTWIPTYNLLRKYYAISRHAESKDQYVFTATRLINLCTSKNHLLQCLNENADKPVLIVNFQEDMLKKAFAESLAIKGSYYYVLTPGNEVVSHSGNVGGDPKSSPDREWTRRASEAGSGTEIVRINGKKMVVCFDKIATTGWLSAVFIPYDNLLSTVPNMVTFTIYSTGVAMLLSVFFASITSGRIVRPVKKLMIGIKRMGEGHFNSKIEAAGSGELVTLIHKFNQMNDKIQLLIDENYQVRIKEMEAELKALNFQFNPHFLYNTLNTLNYLAIENEQPVISHFLVELSEMLSYTAKGPGLVPFREDYRYLQNYVSIMKLRFQEKFQVRYDIDPMLLEADVPKFLLQPFVENALIHGLEEREADGVIEISGKRSNDRLIFTVADNGKGIEPEVLQNLLKDRDTNSSGRGHHSIGIENVDKRIKLLYGAEYGVNLESAPGAGTKVTIVLPYTDKNVTKSTNS
ncbi:cache domain-containing sensor histidine kinase [Paenibacillus hamazuiensis]|uniref:cache domain-containing sensor histidine kinase n=1 Tax=Paenibacillus hamazuiensis TaxID=2936508 RepID=UPI0020109921|nr:sensor histidine kinase [Paenibacillus hamazuiensis]